MQLNIFDLDKKPKKVTKPIRLIELFAGYGSQHFALKYLGANVEHWKICEWAVKSIQAYKDGHCIDDTDYSKDMTKEELIDYLFNKGISQNYNEPMTLQQIKRQNENWLRTVYNNIIATKNLVNIQQVKGSDLEIVDTDKYEYIMTYSFPCQDLSLAGKRAGMSDTSTRSGMLWEVERILDEIQNDNLELPQILLMENVPQVIGTKNVGTFNKWKRKLEKLGYKNYHQNLIATDYGIPQTRNRTFMISILGDYSYTFPQPIPLKLKLKDMLEPNVDEKYYLSDKMLKGMMNTNFEQYKLENKLKDTSGNADTIVARFEGCPQLVKDNLKTEHGLRIRKFTPREVFRLMGVKDEDYERIAKNQSNSSLYHLAGDSIVIDVLMYIFNQLFLEKEKRNEKNKL